MCVLVSDQVPGLGSSLQVFWFVSSWDSTHESASASICLNSAAVFTSPPETCWYLLYIFSIFLNNWSCLVKDAWDHQRRADKSTGSGEPVWHAHTHTSPTSTGARPFFYYSSETQSSRPRGCFPPVVLVVQGNPSPVTRDHYPTSCSASLSNLQFKTKSFSDRSSVLDLFGVVSSRRFRRRWWIIGFVRRRRDVTDQTFIQLLPPLQDVANFFILLVPHKLRSCLNCPRCFFT